MEYAFFDPVRKEYKVLRSQPIALKVKPTSPVPSPEAQAKELFQNRTEIEQPHPEEEGGWRAAWDQPQFSVVKGGYPLHREELETSRIGVKMLWLLPIAALLWAQVMLRTWLLQRRLRSHSSSELLLEQFERWGKQDHLLFQHVETLLLEALLEKKFIINKPETPEDLPQEGICGQVRTFLLQLQEQRFASQGVVEPVEVIHKTKILYQEIR
jgi:hypothetical protein